MQSCWISKRGHCSTIDIGSEDSTGKWEFVGERGGTEKPRGFLRLKGRGDRTDFLWPRWKLWTLIRFVINVKVSC